MSPYERRHQLWLIVFRRKSVSVQELADELEVCARTIRYDIAHMIGSYPITTVRGKYTGCVTLEDEKVELNVALTEKQINFLFRVHSEMQDDDAAAMWDIIMILTTPKQ